MAFEESNNMVMPVAPAYAGNNSGFGFGGDWAWILLLLVLFGGGWNNGFGGGWGGNNDLYPWMNNSNQINGGFRDQMLSTQLNGIQSSVTSGFGDVQNSLCAGFAGVNATVNGASNALAQQMYTNTIADLERSFASQTASTQGMTALQAQLAQCCCDNRSATQDVKFALATEACATRNADATNTRDIIDSQTRGTQAILDKLCALEIDAKNDTIAQLRSQINELSRNASQTAQTAAILANNEAQTAALEQYLAPVPRPAYIVQNPSCCNYGYGCNG